MPGKINQRPADEIGEAFLRPGDAPVEFVPIPGIARARLNVGPGNRQRHRAKSFEKRLVVGRNRSQSARPLRVELRLAEVSNLKNLLDVVLDKPSRGVVAGTENIAGERHIAFGV